MDGLFPAWRANCPHCATRLNWRGRCPRCGLCRVRQPAALTTRRSRLLFLAGAILLGHLLSDRLDALGYAPLSLDRILVDALLSLVYFLLFRLGYRYCQRPTWQQGAARPPRPPVA